MGEKVFYRDFVFLMYDCWSARHRARAGADRMAKPYWKGGRGGPRDQEQQRCQAPCTALAAAWAGKAPCTLHVGNTIRCSPGMQRSSALSNCRTGEEQRVGR